MWRFGLIRMKYGLCLLVLAATTSGDICDPLQAQRRPNILLAISDDQSFAHNSQMGTAEMSTPGFDRIGFEMRLLLLLGVAPRVLVC